MVEVDNQAESLLYTLCYVANITRAVDNKFMCGVSIVNMAADRSPGQSCSGVDDSHD